MHTLYLTGEEGKKFSVLPEAVRSTFSVEKETLTYKDSPKRRGVRFSLLQATDPQVQAVKDVALSSKTDEEFLEAAKAVDMRKVSEEQIADVLFALGPDVIGHFLVNLLSHAKTSDDMELIAALSEARHAMLSSLTSALVQS